MAPRLSSLTPAWVLYITGVVLLGGYVTIAVAHGLSKRVVPVTIQRVGPAPAHDWLNRTFHHNQTMVTYQDLSGVGDTSWEFWIKYHACPVTAHGALRLTLYKTRRTPDLRSPVAAERQKQLYSRTLVERQSSGSTTYLFPGSAETYFFIRVQVPSRAGCAGWQYGAMTN